MQRIHILTFNSTPEWKILITVSEKNAITLCVDSVGLTIKNLHMQVIRWVVAKASELTSCVAGTGFNSRPWHSWFVACISIAQVEFRGYFPEKGEG